MMIIGMKTNTKIINEGAQHPLFLCYTGSVPFQVVMNQAKSNYYYVFWGIMSISVVLMCGFVAHSNYTLAEERSEMAEAIKEYVLVKPFPILCRDAVY